MSDNPIPVAPAAPATSPVNPDVDEPDPSYGDDLTSSTASLNSSIRDYRQLHGRTYANYGDQDYWAPNDSTHNDSLDIVHHMYTILLDNKLFKAPIGPSPQKVIDIGTGTGIWAIDFADEFPSAEVIGTDLSPTQPTFVPPNCKFEVDNAELEWTFGVDSVDYVHLRCLLGSMADWPRLYSQAYKTLKPGGYIEHFEMSLDIKSDDGTVLPDGVMQHWHRRFIEAGEKMGKSFAIFEHVKQHITDAGFVDIHETIYKVPIGGWSNDPKSKEVGRWNLLQIDQGLEGFALFILLTVLQWEYSEVQALLGQMRAACRNPRIHGYYEMTCVYGQKPEKSK